MNDIPTLILLAVILLAFGYIVANSREFNGWKFGIAGLLLLMFFEQYKPTGITLTTMAGAFLIGYLLPYARLLEGLRDAISDAINAVRYRDAYEDIKRKEAEVEELRRHYEQQRANDNRREQEQARRERRQQSEDFRRREQSQASNSGPDSDHSDTPRKSSLYAIRNQHLRSLGLEPDKIYTKQEIKLAFRRMAQKWHPDKHQTNQQQAKHRFQEINAAYEWLCLNDR